MFTMLFTDKVRHSKQPVVCNWPPLFEEQTAQQPILSVSSLSFTSLLSRVMNTGSQFVMEGVKNLVLKQQVSTLLGKHSFPGIYGCRYQFLLD